MGKNKNQNFFNGFSGKRSLITVILVLTASAAVGLAMWFVMNKNMEKENEASKRSISNLESTVRELKDQVGNVTTNILTESAIEAKDQAENYMTVRKNDQGTGGIAFFTAGYLAELGGTQKAKTLLTGPALASIKSFNYLTMGKLSEDNFKVTYQYQAVSANITSKNFEYLYLQKVGDSWKIYKDSLFTTN